MVYNTLLLLITSTKAENLQQAAVNTQQIAQACDLERSNVSKELNKLCDEGRVAKTPGRPVLYKIIDLPHPNARLESSECDVLKENLRQNSDSAINFNIECDQIGFIDNPFKPFIGAEGSLSAQVEQGIAAVTYPGGLDILITGPSGSGKTLFAELLYKTAAQKGVIPSNAPFVTFNCADYASNPQLLLGQLFGSVKGAFTGANRDRPGLVKVAEEGFLFLDEVHRLPPEGQEMLYLILDRGVYHRLGEPDNLQPIQLRFMAATTEDPSTTLLAPFIRRIPVVINLPSLAERPSSEKQALIVAFFQNEAKKVNMPLNVKGQALACFLSFRGSGNVGQLKSYVQLTCANALYKINHQRNKKAMAQDKTLLVDLDSLPKKMFENLPVLKWWNHDLTTTNISIESDSVSYENKGLGKQHAAPCIDIPDEQLGHASHSVKVLIVAHGVSTAKSISSFVNQLIETDIVFGLDISLGVSTHDFIEMARQLFKSFHPVREYIVFVDMPALASLINSAAVLTDVRAHIVENISTPLIIESARLSSKKKLSAEQVYEKLSAASSTPWLSGNLSVAGTSSTFSKVILTTCISGTGTADRVKRLLADVFPHLLTAGCSIISLKAEQIKGEAVFNITDEFLPPNAQILMAIGTVDPRLPEVSFIPIEDFMTDHGIKKVADLLNNLLGLKNPEDISKRLTNALSVETLLEYLTLLNPRIAVNSSHQFIEYIEQQISKPIVHKVRLRLLVHTACMLERLVTNHALVYPKEKWQSSHNQIYSLLTKLRSAAGALENGFSITIPDDELVIIAEIILNEELDTDYITST